jgi:hypothetical protein
MADVGTILGATFKTLGNQLLTDVEGVLTSQVVAFFTNVKANPTTQNVLAQGVVLQASLLMQGPTLESAAISQIASDGLALVAQIKPVIAPPST